MAIPGFFPAQVGPVTVSCPTVGAGLPSSITQLTFSVWSCTGSISFESTDHLIFPGGFQILCTTGGGGPIPTPDVPTFAAVDINAGNHPSPYIARSLTYNGNVPCYDQTEGDVRYASSLEVHYLVAIDLVANQVIAYANDTALTLASGSWSSAIALVNTALAWQVRNMSASNMGDLWAAPAFIDISVEANRRQFINADLSAVELPSNGQVTIGGSPVSPTIFLHALASGSASDFTTNNGSGPAWAVGSGSLAFAGFGDERATNSCMGIVEPEPVVVVTAPDYLFSTPENTELILPADSVHPTSNRVPPVNVIVYTTTPDPDVQGYLEAEYDGSIHYWPSADWTGTDHFSYVGLEQSVPGAQSATGHIAIEVTGPPPRLGMGEVKCRTIPQPTNNLISLRWSDDRGHSWGNPVTQDIGAAGQYLTSLQWQRLGYARDRVFELSWSVPCRTALQGTWIDATPGQS